MVLKNPSFRFCCKSFTKCGLRSLKTQLSLLKTVFACFFSKLLLSFRRTKEGHLGILFVPFFGGVKIVAYPFELKG